MTRAEKIALALIFIGNAFAIWSAINPSYFTIRKFAQREGSQQDQQDLKRGFIVAGVLVAASLFGTLLIFRKR